MKIILSYKSQPNKVLDYNPSVSSLPTRSDNGLERFIHAVVPKEIEGDSNFLDRLALSAHHNYIGTDDLVEFI